MMGKYLNGYPAEQSPVSNTKAPGLDRVGRGRQPTRSSTTTSRKTGRSTTTATGQEDYLTDVLSGLAGSFYPKMAANSQPFFLEVATFAPHAPLYAGAALRHAFAGMHGA